MVWRTQIMNVWSNVDINKYKTNQTSSTWKFSNNWIRGELWLSRISRSMKTRIGSSEATAALKVFSRMTLVAAWRRTNLKEKSWKKDLAVNITNPSDPREKWTRKRSRCIKPATAKQTTANINLPFRLNEISSSPGATGGGANSPPGIGPLLQEFGC